MTVWVMVILVILLSGFIIVKIDQRRWKRYRLHRDVYFKKYPYLYQGSDQFQISLSVSKLNQLKLLNLFMLKPTQQDLFKNMYLLLENRQCHNRIQVIVDELYLGILETDYAAQLSGQLAHTDFMIGRPIEVLAKIFIFAPEQDQGLCKVCLDLPLQPQQILYGLKEPLNIENSKIMR